MFRTLEGRPPAISLPDGAIDCHMHIFDSSKYEAQPGGPGAPLDAVCSDYERVQKWLGIEGVVIVQGNAYQFDNSCTLDALDYFGPSAKAIVAVRPDIADQTLDNMTAQGVVGARLMNLSRGAAGMDMLPDINARVHPFGWSLILQFDGREIDERYQALAQIKGNYVIDHVGKFLEPIKLDSPPFKALLKLIDKGNCYIKIAGFYETSTDGHPAYSDIAQIAKTLVEYAPDRIIWGTNFPHNMVTSAESYPDDVHLLDLVNDWIGSDENRKKVFVDNPTGLYGF